jgi:hypothetical protein
MTNKTTYKRKTDFEKKELFIQFYFPLSINSDYL